MSDKPSNTFDQVDEDSWDYYESPSKAGEALRYGINSLLTDKGLRFSRQAATPLAALEALHWMERALELERALLIAQARAGGASWSDIGRRLGLTKQAVHHRYDRVVKGITELVSRHFTRETYEEFLDYIDANFDAWPEDSYGEEDPETEGNAP